MHPFIIRIFKLIFLFSVQSCTSVSSIPLDLELEVIQLLGVDIDSTSYGVVKNYTYQLEVRNSDEDIYFTTQMKNENVYALELFEVSKEITEDSTLRYSTLVDRVGQITKLQAKERKSLIVNFSDEVMSDITPDTLWLYFTYYLDSIYYHQKRLELIIPVDID